MTIIVHHLQRSQSERIIWLLEELGLPYEVKTYRRDFQTLMAPAEFKALHPTGAAPIMQDGDLTLAESSAIMMYILGRYAPASPFVVPPSAPNFADYLYWLHWSVGTFSSAVAQPFFLKFAGVAPENPASGAVKARLDTALGMLDARLRETGAWLAGDEFTAADIYPVFSVSTMRLFSQTSLEGYDGILAWLKRIGERPAYQRVAKAEEGEDRGIWPVLGVEVPPAIVPQAGGR